MIYSARNVICGDSRYAEGADTDGNGLILTGLYVKVGSIAA